MVMMRKSLRDIKITLIQFLGRVLVPGTGYVMMVWETFGMMVGAQFTKLAVEFEDLQFHQATVLDPKQEVKLQVVIQKGLVL